MGDFIHVLGNEGEVLEVELDDDGTLLLKRFKVTLGNKP